jgi:type IV pilus assembly protein PilC
MNNTKAEKFNQWLDHLRVVPSEEKIFFTQNLAIMLQSGVPAARALATLSQQTNNRKFKRILSETVANVEKGKTLSESFALYPKVFPPIYVNMIKAAEQSGQLENVLTELTRQMKKNHELTRKVKGALMYPLAILVAMLGIGAGMMIFVVPKIVSIFAEMNVQLPLPTRILITISTGFNKNLFLIGLGALLIIALFSFVTRRGIGQRWWHGLILQLPIIKTIARKINLARISRTLGSLLEADLPIVDSLKLTAAIVKNVHYRCSLLALADNVEKGKTMSSILPQFGKLYPPVVEQMMAVGEESGAIAKILSQLAFFYEDDVTQTMDSLPSLIEPILILILGSAVGGMAVAIVLPMFKITEAI